MNKIMGFLKVWGAEDWIRSALDQALEFCDKVMVVVSAFNPRLRRFEDDTYQICREYRDVELLDFHSTKNTVGESASEVYNYMLERSNLCIPGNWVWILDVDEFYTETAFGAIRVAIESNKYDYIRVEEKFFLINMQHYLKGSHGRLMKIKDKTDGFVISNQWIRKPESLYVLPEEDGMFHYSLLTNTDQRLLQWEFDLPGRTHLEMRKWLTEIYLKYDLENEDYWLEKNLKLSGIRSPWFNNDFSPNEDGKLFRYTDRHPKFIEKTALPRVADFRNYYGKNDKHE